MRRKHLDRDEVWRGESHVNSRVLIVARVDKVLIEENGDVARHTSQHPLHRGGGGCVGYCTWKLNICDSGSRGNWKTGTHSSSSLGNPEIDLKPAVVGIKRV